MAERDTIFKSKIKQDGLFDFKDFYSFAYDWLINEGYTMIEKKYSEKVAGDAKGIEIDWEAKKKISDYFRFVIKMNWTIVNMKQVEVQREGKKIKMNTGLVEIRFTGILEKDYESKWEDKPLWKFLRGIYDRYIIKSRIETYEANLSTEANELINQCKSFLAIEGKR